MTFCVAWVSLDVKWFLTSLLPMRYVQTFAERFRTHKPSAPDLGVREDASSFVAMPTAP